MGVDTEMFPLKAFDHAVQKDRILKHSAAQHDPIQAALLAQGLAKVNKKVNEGRMELGTYP